MSFALLVQVGEMPGAPGAWPADSVEQGSGASGIICGLLLESCDLFRRGPARGHGAADVLAKLPLPERLGEPNPVIKGPGIRRQIVKAGDQQHRQGRVSLPCSTGEPGPAE